MSAFRRLFVAGIVSLCVCGCHKPVINPEINMLHPGMTKQQVIEVMGEPVSTTVTYTNEYLNYALAEGCSDSVTTAKCPLTPYFVRLIYGKVDTYGRAGEFTTMQMPPQKITPQ